MSLLGNVAESDVSSHPYPCVVVRNVLDDEHCQWLVQQFPTIATVTKGRNEGNNKRFSYPCLKAQNDPRVADIWKQLVKQHVSQQFLDDLIRVFGKHIRATYPSFEMEFGRLDELRAGLRGVDTFDDADILLDAMICVNTPVKRRPSSVRSPHVDLPNKLFAGLFYLRVDDDDSHGGALELYAARDGIQPRYEGQFTSRRFLDVVRTVEYERNVLVLFVNSPKSLHGVTVHSVTRHPRLFLTLVGEVRKPLFTLPQVRPLEKIANRFKRLLGRAA